MAEFMCGRCGYTVRGSIAGIVRASEDHDCPDARMTFIERFVHRFAGRSSSFFAPHPANRPRYFEGLEIRIDSHIPIGQIIATKRTIFIHPRDVMRLDYGPGIEGELAASLAWINHRIALAADRAIRRIDQHHNEGAEHG